MRGSPGCAAGRRVTREQIIQSVDDRSSGSAWYLDPPDPLPDRYVPMFGSVAYDCKKEREDAVSFEEQAKAMGELVKSGKIRAWGLSNETPLGVSAFVAAAIREGAPPPVSVQNSYSLLQRSDEVGLVEAMRHHDVGYLPYSPLSAGVLSGKYDGLAAAPKNTRLDLFDAYFERYANTCAFEAPSATSRSPSRPACARRLRDRLLRLAPVPRRRSSARRRPSSSRSTCRFSVPTGRTSQAEVARIHAYFPARGAWPCAAALAGPRARRRSAESSRQSDGNEAGETV